MLMISIRNISFKTSNILSKSAMRRFWIDIRKEANGEGVRIVVGKGSELVGFMRRSWESNRYNAWPPTHVAFAASESGVDYKFCLEPDVTPQVEGSRIKNKHIDLFHLLFQII